MVLGRVVLVLGLTLLSLTITTPLHEYAHCTFSWYARGDDGECIVVYNKPTGDTPIRIQCVDQNCTLLNESTKPGRVSAYVVADGAWQNSEHQAIYEVIGFLRALILMGGLAWAFRLRPQEPRK